MSSSNELGLRTAPTPIWREFLAGLEASQAIFVSSLDLLFAERDDLGPVITVPGFLATEISLAGLFFDLSSRGYKTHTSGLGINWRCLEESAEIVAETEHRVFIKCDGLRVDLVGWSAGGIVAARTKQMNPTETGRVVTIGTPQRADAAVHPWIVALVKVNRSRMKLRRPNCFTANCDCLVGKLIREGLNPDVCVYSDTDGIVESESTQHENPACNRLAKGSTHSTMGMDFAVSNIVTRELAKGRRN